MSIVLEALEKAQREGIKRQKREGLPQKRPLRDVPLPSAKKRSRSYGVYFWIFILCIAGLNLWFLGWWLNRNKTTVSINPFATSIRSLKTPSRPLQEKGLSNGENVVSSPENSSVATALKGTVISQENGRPILTVKGIVWDTYEPIALVNGKFLTIGDEILGATVKKININSVSFLYKEEEFTIAIQQ